MYNLKLYPYKMGSESAKSLASVLNIMRVRGDGDYRPKHGHVIINWGSSAHPVWIQNVLSRGAKILNPLDKVNVAGNKLSALRALKAAGVLVPEFTTDIDIARRWVRSGETVVERHELRGNSGAGIRIVNLDDPDMPSVVHDAPLYTKFIPKTAEFRVHVFRGEVIDYIEKKKVAAERRTENFNRYVSSIHQGWVFTRTNVRDIPEVRNIAINAVRALGLDFGAVDIIYYEGSPYVLEVNTAPGLSGTTLVKYANAFRRYMGAPDLQEHVVREIVGTDRHVLTQPAVNLTQARTETWQQNDLVTLRIDRATALKIKELLAHVS